MDEKQPRKICTISRKFVWGRSINRDLFPVMKLLIQLLQPKAPRSHNLS